MGEVEQTFAACEDKLGSRYFCEGCEAVGHEDHLESLKVTPRFRRLVHAAKVDCRVVEASRRQICHREDAERRGALRGFVEPRETRGRHLEIDSNRSLRTKSR
eukprot:Gb_20137 [translate_table: standard]